MSSTEATHARGTDWKPAYSRWRHGGWYISNLSYQNGAVGCVSRNYPDGKWRIVCDERDPQPTYTSRDEAAFAERELVRSIISRRASERAS